MIEQQAEGGGRIGGCDRAQIGEIVRIEREDVGEAPEIL